MAWYVKLSPNFVYHCSLNSGASDSTTKNFLGPTINPFLLIKLVYKKILTQDEILRIFSNGGVDCPTLQRQVLVRFSNEDIDVLVAPAPPAMQPHNNLILTL